MKKFSESFSVLINDKRFKIFLAFFFGYIIIALSHATFSFKIDFIDEDMSFFLKDLFFKNLFIAFFSSCIISFFPLVYLVSNDWKKFIKGKYLNFLLTFSVVLFIFSSLIFAIRLAEEYFLPWFESL